MPNQIQKIIEDNGGTVEIKKIVKKKVSVLDKYYKLYEHGRKKQKAPQNYIDYFQSARFLLNEIDFAVAKDRKRIQTILEDELLIKCTCETAECEHCQRLYKVMEKVDDLITKKKQLISELENN